LENYRHDKQFQAMRLKISLSINQSSIRSIAHVSTSLNRIPLAKEQVASYSRNYQHFLQGKFHHGDRTSQLLAPI
jgi:hypothetical protein